MKRGGRKTAVDHESKGDNPVEHPDVRFSFLAMRLVVVASVFKTRRQTQIYVVYIALPFIRHQILTIERRGRG